MYQLLLLWSSMGFNLVACTKVKFKNPVGRCNRKEGNVLFNYALNTFYLRLYGVRHMEKDHLDSERGYPLPPHGLLFPISSKGFYMHHPTDRITHTTIFVTRRGALAETRNSSMGPPRRIDLMTHRTPRANTLTTELHLAPGVKATTSSSYLLTLGKN